MSHVDEGRLHAFLDGALSAADPADAERVELHLASCADCRARHDEAARLRDMASGLLGGAHPREFVMPSFDAIRSRAALVAPAQRVKSSILKSPFNDFAWAAMVILAIGLGWMLNDTMEEPNDLVSIREIPLARPDAAPAESVVYIPMPPAGERGDVESAAAPEVVRQPAADADAGPPDVSERQSERRLADEAPARAQRAAEYEVVEEAADEAPLASVAPAEPQVRQESRDFAAAAPAGADSRRAEASSARAPAAAPPPAAQAGIAEVDADDALAGAGAGAPMGELENGWREVTLAEAQRLTGGHVVRLAGARILTIAARGSGYEVELRSVQITDRGESIQVDQRRTVRLEARSRESLESSAGERPPIAVTAGLTVRVDDWTVTISGAVPPYRLRELSAGLG